MERREKREYRSYLGLALRFIEDVRRKTPLRFTRKWLHRMQGQQEKSVPYPERSGSFLYQQHKYRQRGKQRLQGELRKKDLEKFMLEVHEEREIGE